MEESTRYQRTEEDSFFHLVYCEGCNILMSDDLRKRIIMVMSWCSRRRQLRRQLSSIVANSLHMYKILHFNYPMLQWKYQEDWKRQL